MAAIPDLTETYQAGVAAYEKFVADSIAINKAWREGKLEEWLNKYWSSDVDSDRGANPPP